MNARSAVAARPKSLTLVELHAAGEWPPYAEDEPTARCCLGCGHRYDGPLACPKCGEPGEPLGEYRRREAGRKETRR
jgi:hypothetical protein